MMNLLLNLLGFGLFLLLLFGAFWISAIFMVVLLGVFIVGFVALKIWMYLIQKRILNPRPGYPMQQDDVIDVEFTRVEEKRIHHETDGGEQKS